LAEGRKLTEPKMACVNSIFGILILKISPAKTVVFLTCIKLSTQTYTSLYWFLALPLGVLALYLLPPTMLLNMGLFRAFSCISSVSARHSSSGRQPNFAARDEEGSYRAFAPRLRHLYFTGRPSSWISAHVSSLLYILTVSVSEITWPENWWRTCR